MTIRTIKPLGMLLVRIKYIRHRTLDFTDNIQVHNNRFRHGVHSIKTRLYLALLKRLDPVNIIAGIISREQLKRILWWLQGVPSYGGAGLRFADGFISRLNALGSAAVAPIAGKIVSMNSATPIMPAETGLRRTLISQSLFIIYSPCYL